MSRTVNFPWWLHEPINVFMSTGEHVRASDDDGKWEHHEYKVVIRWQGRMMRSTFSQGMAYAKDNVDVGELLSSLAEDYLSGQDQTFEEWAGDYGYDTDSRKAYAIYEALKENRKRMDRVFGDEVGNFVEYFREKDGDY